MGFDLGFCLVFLPLMIFMFPVERWWGTYPVFFSLFVAWLYATYFLYKYFIVPNLFHSRRLRLYALAAQSTFSLQHAQHALRIVDFAFRQGGGDVGALY